MNSNSAKITLAALTALGSMAGFAHGVRASIVINEIYGGGGFAASAAPATLPASVYAKDFIELYNNGTDAVDISGYRVAYGSAASTSVTMSAPGTTNGVTLGTGISIPAGGYFLLTGTNTSAAGLTLVGDATISADLSGTAGRVGLYASATATSAVDFVGYGTATAFEGTGPASGFAVGTSTSGISSLNRTLGVDSNNNAGDFTLGAPSPTAVPEPATLGLAAAAGALLIGRRRK